MKKISNKYLRRFLAVIWFVLAACTFFLCWIGKVLSEVLICAAFSDFSQFISESHKAAIVLLELLICVFRDLWAGE